MNPAHLTLAAVAALAAAGAVQKRGSRSVTDEQLEMLNSMAASGDRSNLLQAIELASQVGAPLTLDGLVFQTKTSTRPLDRSFEREGKYVFVGEDISSLKEYSFSGFKLKNVFFFDCDLEGVDFSGANITGGSGGYHSSGGDLVRGGRFVGCNLKGANFDDATLNRVEFKKVNASGSTFRNAYLSGCYLQSRFQGADFTGAKIHRGTMAGGVFVGADFQGATLYRVNVAQTIFINADLRGVDLRDVSIHMTNRVRGMKYSPGLMPQTGDPSRHSGSMTPIRMLHAHLEHHGAKPS